MQIICCGGGHGQLGQLGHHLIPTFMPRLLEAPKAMPQRTAMLAGHDRSLDKLIEGTSWPALIPYHKL